MLTVCVRWERMIWNGSKHCIHNFITYVFFCFIFSELILSKKISSLSPLSTFITRIFFCYIQISQNLNFIILFVNVQVFHVYFLCLCFPNSPPLITFCSKVHRYHIIFLCVALTLAQCWKTQIANAARKNKNKTHRNLVWNCFTWAILTMHWYSNWMRSCVPKILWTNNIWHDSNTIRPNQATRQRHKQWQTFKFNIKIWMCR